MKKRMRILGLLLTGGIILMSQGGLSAQAAERQPVGSPVAGISGVFAGILAEERTLADTQSTREVPDMAARVLAMTEQTVQEQTAGTSVNEVPVVTSEYADIAVAQVDNYVNVRLEPNTESEVLGKLYNNSAATVLEVTEDGWYRIVSGNVEGYVKSEYVVVGNEELARAVGTRYATVTTTTLFVRNEPTTEAPILTMLPEADDLVVLDESVEGWAKVSTVEGDGYISTDYVNLSTVYIHAESKAEEEERLAREEAERQAAAKAAEEARRAREAEEAAKRAAEAAKNAKPSTGGSNSASSNSASGAGTSGTGGGSSASEGGSGSSSVGSAISNGQAVADYARQFIGNPYVYGGTSLTNGADCSGFVQSVYKAFGVSLPRNSTAQRGAGYAVSVADIQPGDLVCYSGHIGIYGGNNTLIHASNERTGITQTSPINYRPILAVRRIF